MKLLTDEQIEQSALVKGRQIARLADTLCSYLGFVGEIKGIVHEILRNVQRNELLPAACALGFLLDRIHVYEAAMRDINWMDDLLAIAALFRTGDSSTSTSCGDSQ